MKNLILIIALIGFSLTGSTVTTCPENSISMDDEYNEGWKDGYCEGWKDVKGQFAYCPYPPYPPYPKYDCPKGYRCGYNRGFKAGMRAAQR